MEKKDERELLEAFRGMSSENQRHFLAYANVALVAQESAKKAMESMGKETDKKSEKKIA